MFGKNKVELDQPKAKVFVFKDEKSESYGPPITYENRGMFIRDFVQAGLQSGQPIWAKHPQDFTLFELGEYDARSGQIELYESKFAVGLVQDFVVARN